MFLEEWNREPVEPVAVSRRRERVMKAWLDATISQEDAATELRDLQQTSGRLVA
jgi:hypothetical protein